MKTPKRKKLVVWIEVDKNGEPACVNFPDKISVLQCIESCIRECKKYRPGVPTKFIEA